MLRFARRFCIIGCAKIPTEVATLTGGEETLGYIEFWPCDIYNPYQRWELGDDGTLRPRLMPNLAVEWHHDYGAISKPPNNRPNNMIILDPKGMSKDFLTTRSKVNTTWYEIGLRYYYSIALNE
ncbi:hypothetical protein [Piscirickettsia salmonis]|uniref:hypothetical protein n=1 Tax=Piscirickettsia salmonis TaxID=1238 RepID=UPI0015CF1A4A|nr:hypothetical protein [Piscirickettsia salmonis]